MNARARAWSTAGMARPDAPLPVELGSMLFTCVEPHRGHEVAYNRWYERDHFYSGVLAGAYSLAGRRFVATHEEKALREPVDSPVCPDPTSGSYLAVYWVQAGAYEAWNRWSVDEVNRLHAAGRMFGERSHVYTIVAHHDWGVFRDADGVPAELALEHPYEGLVATVAQAGEGVAREDIDAWHRSEFLPELQSGSPVAMSLCFTPVPLSDDAPPDVPRSPTNSFVMLHFAERAANDTFSQCFAGYGDALAKSGLGNLLWASPFRPTLPGTDTYTDQLW